MPTAVAFGAYVLPSADAVSTDTGKTLIMHILSL
jgi:hypothetical protein